MGKPGPETKLVAKMRKAGHEKYGHDRLVIIKYHGSQYSQAGVSDLLVCLDGNFGATEVKSPENYGGSEEKALEKGPTTNQLSFIRKINAAGGIACVTASVPAFMMFLETLERGEWPDD